MFAYTGRGLIKNLSSDVSLKVIELPFEHPNLILNDHETLVKIIDFEHKNFSFQDSVLLHCYSADSYTGRDVFKQAYGYTFFDLPISKEIVAGCNKMDKIFTPSVYHQKELINSGVTKPVIPIPPGVDEKLFFPVDKVLNPEGKFTFLSIGEFDPLKNGFDLIINAFLECFHDKNDVRLILFWLNNNNSLDDITQMSLFIREQKENKGITESNILLFNAQLYERDLKMLYSSADVFLAPFRYNHWPREIFESLLCEIPVITTGVEYIRDFNNFSSFVNYSLAIASISPEKAIKYANPDYEQLKYIMIDCYNNYNKYKQNAIEGRNFLLNNYSWERVNNKLLKELA